MFEQHNTELGFDAHRLLLSMLAGVLLLVIAGVISTLSGASDYFFLWALGLAIVVSIVRQLVRDKRRKKDIREFALRLGFTYLDSALPTSFPLHRTSSSRARSISGAGAGELSHKEILFFDCELGHGKGRFSRTVVAMRGERADFGAARFGPDLSTEEVGGWTVVYGERRLLQIGEIDSLVFEASQRRVPDNSSSKDLPTGDPR